MLSHLVTYCRHLLSGHFPALSQAGSQIGKIKEYIGCDAEITLKLDKSISQVGCDNKPDMDFEHFADNELVLE